MTPAPDGRGSPQPEPPRRFGGWPFVLLLVAMLALNFALSQAALEPPERVRIPYQPTFLQQIREDNVRSIASEDASVQGELRRAIRYPANDKKAPRSKRFDTHVPAFANKGELSRLLAQHDVTVDARPPETGAPLWERLVVGLLPTLLCSACWSCCSGASRNAEAEEGSRGWAARRPRGQTPRRSR